MWRSLVFLQLLWVGWLWAEGPVVKISWEDCLAEAAKWHPDLIVAEEQVAQSTAGLQVAKGARLPEVTASADVAKTRTRGVNGESSGVGLVARVTAFDGGLKKSGERQARAELATDKISYRVTSADLRYKLRQAYIQLWQAQESVRIAQSIVRLRSDSYRLINLNYDAGTENKGSLKLAEAKQAQAQTSLANAARDIVTAQAALAQAMGMPASENFEVEGLPMPAKVVGTDDLKMIVDTHPELEVAEAREETAKAKVAAARAGFWPEVTVSASAQRRSDNIPPEDNTGNVSAELSYTIFNGNAREAQLQKAKAALRSAQASTAAVYNRLYSALELARNELAKTIDGVEVQEKFLQANEEREKIAQAQYRVGLLRYNEWTIIEDNLVASRQAYLQAKAEALRALAAWEKATGENL